MREVSRVRARPYARALLRVVEGDEAALRLRGELRQIAAVIRRNAELRAALQHPRVDSRAQGRVLVALAETGGASELLRRFVSLLAERDDVSQLLAVAEAYFALVNKAHGIIPVDVTAATPLEDGQEQALVKALRATTGGELELTTHVDPRLLGGLRVQVAGRTFDGTVRAQLASLRRRLASGS